MQVPIMNSLKILSFFCLWHCNNSNRRNKRLDTAANPTNQINKQQNKQYYRISRHPSTPVPPTNPRSSGNRVDTVISRTMGPAMGKRPGAKRRKSRWRLGAFSHHPTYMDRTTSDMEKAVSQDTRKHTSKRRTNTTNTRQECERYMPPMTK